ncbi:hypothetical protein [Ensifer sesbaniae]
MKVGDGYYGWAAHAPIDGIGVFLNFCG